MPTLTRLRVGGTLRGWKRAGFLVEDREIRLEGITIEVTDDPDVGIAGWGVTGVETDLDGLRCIPAEPAAPATPQPNNVTGLDHVVGLTRDLELTGRALSAAGIEARRTRDVPDADPPRRQVFHVLDTALLELMGPTQGSGAAGTARLWGLAFVSSDLEDTVDALGLLAGEVRDAVQPGRRIATLRHQAAGLTIPTVLMSPRR